ncbi:alpha/beta hydrolase [uncultured Neptuniibacter sp.]|uniref:alpha/beta fold hydrolase n=1 Tax=uncultured Neptuniibacter sp. TaxID=502143 RepID=UPI00261ECA4B|nr:alpha/beta hydrolase [uncultured Neptuniibacter sp.]
MMTSPEIGKQILLGDIEVNYHDQGNGRPVLLLHGSGAGVSAWANWRLSIPVLSKFRRVIAPDLVGFGYTRIPDDFEFKFMQSWVDQIIDLLDALDIQQADFVGNSFGASLTLALVVRHPERVGRMVLMGSGGQPFEVSPELSKLWGYKPSFDAMKEILQIMAHDQRIATDELADMRYRATLRDGAQALFERVFPEPHQRWADALVIEDEALARIDQEVLIIHGREDRVVPVHVSEALFKKIRNAQLHLFGSCGHWTQIEQAERFNHLVTGFLNEVAE